MDLPNKGDQQPQPTTPVRQKVEPVIPGAIEVKRPASRRFFGFLFAESPRDLGRKIGREIIVPRLKASFEEAANGFLAGMLWGNSAMRPTQGLMPGTVIRGGTDYRQISSGGVSALDQARQATVTNVVSQSGNYKDLVCATQQHAEILLAAMFDLWNRYRLVSVADLYEAAKMTPQPSDGAYGWTSLEGARIVKVREGFKLELPRPVLI